MRRKKTKLTIDKGYITFIEQFVGNKLIAAQNPELTEFHSRDYHDGLLIESFDCDISYDTRITYEYNDKRKLIKKTSYTNDSLMESIYEYDNEDKIIKETRTVTYSDEEDDTVIVYLYSYDDRGNLAYKIIEGNDVSIKYEYKYDSKDRLIYECDFNGDARLIMYDERGNIRKVFHDNSMTQGTVTSSRSKYNGYNQIIEFIRSSVIMGEENEEVNTKFFYDKHHRLSKMVTRTYDGYVIRSTRFKYEKD